MQLSLNWLKEFVEIPKALTPEELGERLSLHTVEVEKIQYQADKYKGVVVGKILEIKPHPNADRLRSVKIDTGPSINSGQFLEIVCGAANIKVGQLVPVALAGATLPNVREIKSTEIRGVKSNGMLCAEDELGLGSDHAGIMILGKGKTPFIPLYKGDKPTITSLLKGGRGVKVGQKFSDYLKLDDVIFEVDNKSITHRADLWSHYGLARDISAFLNTKFKAIKTPLIPDACPDCNIGATVGTSPLYKGDKNALLLKEGRGGFFLSVKVEDFKLCPRYMALALDGIKVAPSPRWLADRLSACGLRPINNIVDATNYVMLELGQPLHAFDKTRMATNSNTNGNELNIIVRRAKKGEVMETLDGVKRKFDEDTPLITNQAGPVAIAGVMGGANSEISENTTAIIIESANFNFNSVRMTAQKLGLRTEASMRYEKGLDPNLTELGLFRVAELIIKICPGARLASNLVDEKKYKPRLVKSGEAGAEQFDGVKQGPINFDLNWLNQRLGHDFELKQVKQILEKLGFGVKIKKFSFLKEAKSQFGVTVPTWRAVRDIAIAEDVAEEVARIYGFNNIKSVMPRVEMRPPLANEEKNLERKIKNILSVGAKMCEAYNYSFVPSAALGAGGDNTIKLANPLSEDLAVLRPSLTHGLLENIKLNQAKEEFIALYEIGRIFLNQPGRLNLLFQEKHLGLALAAGASADLIRKLKGIIEYLLGSFNLAVKFDVSAKAVGPLTSGRTAGAAIYVAGLEVGWAGELDHGITETYGIKKKTAVAEIRLSELFTAIKNSPASLACGRGRQYSEPAKYPPVIRDLAFVVNEEILYNKIKSELENFSNLIKQADLFDVYQGGRLGAGKKSLAFHIIYQADKTLTSEEVDEIQAKLIKHLEQKLGAKIRNF